MCDPNLVAPLSKRPIKCQPHIGQGRFVGGTRNEDVRTPDRKVEREVRRDAELSVAVLALHTHR